MNLKNYTSSVATDITIGRIERLLVDAGATGIGKEYKSGVVNSLIFQIQFDPQQLPVNIKLPANVEGCLNAFWADYCKTRGPRSNKVKEDFREQAARTAWKLQQDWLEVELSLIRLNQKDRLQAFLAYAWDGQSTVYERIKSNGFKALLPPPTQPEPSAVQ